MVDNETLVHEKPEASSTAIQIKRLKNENKRLKRDLAAATKKIATLKRQKNKLLGKSKRKNKIPSIPSFFKGT